MHVILFAGLLFQAAAPQPITPGIEHSLAKLKSQTVSECGPYFFRHAITGKVVFTAQTKGSTSTPVIALDLPRAVPDPDKKVPAVVRAPAKEAGQHDRYIVYLSPDDLQQAKSCLDTSAAATPDKK